MIEDGEQAVTGEDLQNYLAWHGIQAKLDVFGHRGEKAGKIILDHAKAQNADMIVMGAYTHSRLRQMIFGGVTSHILAHGTCPVLFAH
jgi:nucleotide-binding universal stress UspA family protein